MTAPERSDAFQLGYESWYLGVAWYDCPYLPGTIDRDEWERGRLVAEDEAVTQAEHKADGGNL